MSSVPAWSSSTGRSSSPTFASADRRKAACYAIAGVIRGQTAGQNRLEPNRAHVGGRRRLYRERMRLAVGQPAAGVAQGRLLVG